MSKKHLAITAAGLILAATGGTANAQGPTPTADAPTSVDRDEDGDGDHEKWGLLGLLGLAGLLGLKRRDHDHMNHRP
ncbi:MAG TPA: WGxxGxxG family protein [Sphingomonas sp.]|nr:WGxxGxxG family protein [Sphingomonas sp.]